MISFTVRVTLLFTAIESKQTPQYAFRIACRSCSAIPEVQIPVQYSGNQIIKYPFHTLQFLLILPLLRCLEYETFFSDETRSLNIHCYIRSPGS